MIFFRLAWEEGSDFLRAKYFREKNNRLCNVSTA